MARTLGKEGRTLTATMPIAQRDTPQTQGGPRSSMAELERPEPGDAAALLCRP